MLQRSSTPAYHQLREFLRERIESGEWQAGHQLPTEEQLTVEFGVSRATVRQAIQLLVSLGLLDRTPGRGTFVARPKVVQNLGRLFVGGRTGADLTAERTGQIIHFKVVKPAEAISIELGLASGDQAYEIKRVILIGDEARMVITSWFPVDLMPDLPNRQLPNPTSPALLEAYFKGELLKEHREVEVTVLDGEEAELLHVHAGVPAFLFTTLSQLSDSRVFEFRRMVMRGDRYKFFIDIDLDIPSPPRS